MGLIRRNYWLISCDTCGTVARGGPRADPDQVPGGWERADAGAGPVWVWDRWLVVDVPVEDRKFRCPECRRKRMEDDHG